MSEMKEPIFSDDHNQQQQQQYQPQEGRQSQRYHEDRDDELVLTSKGSFLETVVNAASVINNILMEHCGICTVYCDNQVKYEEWAQEQYNVSTASLNHLFQKINTTTPTVNEEVKQYQEFLFDEQSVLESVASRDSQDGN
jgi:hypothetical protein